MHKVITWAALATLFIVLLSLYGFWQAIHPPKITTNLTPKDLNWIYEEASLTTKDGIGLSAWFVPAKTPTDKTIIMLHGYPADKANLLYWSEFLHQDFNLLFFDFRYFGDSQGNLTTIGYREQNDLEAAIEYLKQKDFENIGAMGFSLGGAVAILTSVKNPDLKAIVSDSSFASLSRMAEEYYKNLFILKYPLSFLTKLWSIIFLGINPDNVSPQETAKNLKIPVFLIHSKQDQTIPFKHAQLIQKSLKNNPKAEFYFIEEGVHGMLSPKVLEEYEKKVSEFFKINL